MSMSALCADRVSCVSSGSASALISRSLPLPVGYCGTSTAVTFPSATVIRTWTGPQRVGATAPVNVVLAPVPDGAPVGGADACGAAGAATTVSPAVAGPDVEVW